MVSTFFLKSSIRKTFIADALLPMAHGGHTDNEITIFPDWRFLERFSTSLIAVIDSSLTTYGSIVSRNFHLQSLLWWVCSNTCDQKNRKTICKALSVRRNTTVLTEEALENFVPATAVIRRSESYSD